MMRFAPSSSFLSSRARMLSAGLAALLLAGAPLAHAHRTWLLPSATVLSGNDPWVTVDAAISNDLFYFEHHPLRVEGLQVIGPDAKPVKAENVATGRYRSTFDVKLDRPGTYRIAVVNENLSASYKHKGETKRWRGNAADFKKQVPADATDVNVTRMFTRVETFATAGKPDTSALQPTGSGLELMPVTHPNDLFAGEEARFRFLIDGEPAANLPVTVIANGVRYEGKVNESILTTDADGQFAVTWTKPGMYWINASYPQRQAGAPAPTGTFDKPVHRAGYSGTVEVLPQ